MAPKHSQQGRCTRDTGKDVSVDISQEYVNKDEHVVMYNTSHKDIDTIREDVCQDESSNTTSSSNPTSGALCESAVDDACNNSKDVPVFVAYKSRAATLQGATKHQR